MGCFQSQTDNEETPYNTISSTSSGRRDLNTYLRGKGNSPLFKVVLLGDATVGKSSLVIRFTDNAFDESRSNTIGVDFKSTALLVQEDKVDLHIWDTAGQERFRTLTSTYYRGAHGIIIVYDITNRQSFLNAQGYWLSEVRKGAPSLPLVMVGNKCDMSMEREVSIQEGEEMGTKLSVPVFEASAKNRRNVDEVFQKLAMMMLGMKES